MGDYVLSQKDVTEARDFDDAIASGSWAIDLHYDDCRPGVDFLTTCKGYTYGRYWIPYRSIYSRNVGNFFAVGRCFSCTHVGLGSPRVINTLSQLGVAAGEAAAICREKGVSPRGLYKDGYVKLLQTRLGGGMGGVPEAKTKGWIIVDDESDGVTFGKGWNSGFNTNGDQIGMKTHYPRKDAKPAVYPLPVKKAGRYVLMGNVPYRYKPNGDSATAMKIVSGGKTVAFTANQDFGTGSWQKLGTFHIEPGATLHIIPEKSRGFVAADGFALVPQE